MWGNDSSSQSFNRYVYALNNPLRYLDATGLAATEGHVPKYDPETAALEAEATYQEAFDEAFRGSAGYYVLVTVSIAGDIAGGLLDLLTSSPKTAIAKKALVRLAIKHGDDDADLLEAAKARLPKLGGRVSINSKFSGKTHPSGIQFNQRGFSNFGPVSC